MKYTKVLAITAGGFLLVACLGGVTAIVNQGADEPKTSPYGVGRYVDPSPEVKGGPIVEVTPESALKGIVEGTYTVGEDMPAGTYKVNARADNDCYWERKAANGDIKANSFGGGFPKVTVAKGETFTTSGCPEFIKVK